MPTVEITSQDKGKTFEINLGARFLLSLPENPTTGFRWAIHTPGEEIIKQIDRTFRPAPDAQIGGGGTCVLSLSVQRAGEHHIQLKRWRVWEGDDSVIEWFHVTVRTS